MASVANDADDLIGLVPDSGPDDQSLAQCFLVREDAVDESLTDDDRLVALAHFLLSKVPSAPQRDSHRAEVVLIHAAKVNKSCIGRGRTAFDSVRHVPGFTTEWQVGNQTDSFDAPQAGDTCLQLRQKGRRLFPRILFLPGQVDAQSQNLVPIE